MIVKERRYFKVGRKQEANADSPPFDMEIQGNKPPHGGIIALDNYTMGYSETLIKIEIRGEIPRIVIDKVTSDGDSRKPSVQSDDSR